MALLGVLYLAAAPVTETGAAAEPLPWHRFFKSAGSASLCTVLPFTAPAYVIDTGAMQIYINLKTI